MSSPAKWFRGRRILVVEDEFLIGFAIASTLSDHGAETLGPIGTLSDALARGEREGLQGALLDLTLGHDTSTAVARVLRRRNIPFILMTGYGDESIPAELEAAPRLRKPFEQAALLEACRSLFM